MIPALTGALIPVAAGIGLALIPALRSERLGPARTFALAAALAVVFGELLPAAGEVLGLLAVVALAVGLAAPAVLERLPILRGARGADLGLLALLAHQCVDGFEVGAAWATQTGALAVTTAIGAHSVPLVAAVVLRIARERGTRAAAWRGGALLAATALGTVAGGWMLPAALPAAWLGALPAVVGGLLLHVLWHDVAEGAAPDTLWSRTVEFGAFGLGAALPLALLAHGGHGHSDLGPTALDNGLRFAPPLLAGVTVGVIARLVAHRLPAWLAQSTPTAHLAEEAVEHGAPAGHLVSGPLLAPTGWVAAGLAIGPLAAVAFAVSVLAGAFANRGATQDEPRSVGLGTAIDLTLREIGPWALVGVAAATFVSTYPVFVGSAAWTQGVVAASVLAGAAIPLVALVPALTVLGYLGLAPAAVAAALVFAPLPGRAAATALFTRNGIHRVMGVLAILAVATAAAGLVPLVRVSGSSSWLHAWALSVLVMMGLHSMWRYGPRAWLAELARLHTHHH